MKHAWLKNTGLQRKSNSLFGLDLDFNLRSHHDRFLGILIERHKLCNFQVIAHLSRVLVRESNEMADLFVDSVPKVSIKCSRKKIFCFCMSKNLRMTSCGLYGPTSYLARQ